MKTKRYILLAFALVLLLLIGSGLYLSLRVKTEVKELFKLNKHLKEEGYYMAEFEFRLLGFGYLMGKGEYLKALKDLSAYHEYLCDKTNLIKIPDFKSKQEEIDFYLDLQHPETGAFMDQAAPFCTYFSNTENMIMHLEALQDSTTKPLKLKYPLSFLNALNTPDKLRAYLDDVSYMNVLGGKYPQTSFHFARDMCSNAMPDNVIERNKLYSFSPEWKHACIQWLYAFQDTATGLWGPKHKSSHKLLKTDINNSASVVKKFRNTNGDDLYPDFPLRYGDKLFRATLQGLQEPVPDDTELEWIHEWNLKQVKGIKMLLSYLWKDASEKNKAEAKTVISNFIQLSFNKYYVEAEGAFSYYPNAEHATVDGMSNMILKRIGALSHEKQTQYWGSPEDNARDLGTVIVDSIYKKDLDTIAMVQDINSWRIYLYKPDFKRLYKNNRAVIYPEDTKVLDITELVPGIVQWTETSSLSTGNWKSMADIKNEYASYNIPMPLVFHQVVPYTAMNDMLDESNELYIIGFDILQVPRFMLQIKKKTPA